MTLRQTISGYRGILIVLILLYLPGLQDTLNAQERDTSDLTGKHPGIRYTSKGFELLSKDENYAMRIQWRGQFRVAIPADLDPGALNQRGDNDQYYMGVNRARMKVGGHAFVLWLKYYTEYELASSNMLDFRIMVEKYPWLNLKVGQWKVHYNRERIISSGKQQMMDRSLLNRFFTVDRQQGVSLYGRVNDGGLADFNYWLSVFNGTGRGGELNKIGNAMYMGRLQWNLFGEPVPFAGSDLAGRENPNGGITIAGLINRSAYTHFSQAGGGNLEGIPIGREDQFGLRQFLIESAFMYQGFTWQQEFHFKRIKDFVNVTTTGLMGNYIQAGYFFNRQLGWVPKPLELAFRYSICDPDRAVSNDLMNEFSIALNWFFRGHNNKLTAEMNFFHFQQAYAGLYDETQFRLQWDISF